MLSWKAIVLDKVVVYKTNCFEDFSPHSNISLCYQYWLRSALYFVYIEGQNFNCVENEQVEKGGYEIQRWQEILMFLAAQTLKACFDSPERLFSMAKHY
jgi:hypothetical protein